MIDLNFSDSLFFLIRGFEVLEDVEVAFVLVLEDLLVLPVSSHEKACRFVNQCWHLVGKQVPHRCVGTASHLLGAHVEEVSISKEFA